MLFSIFKCFCGADWLVVTDHSEAYILLILARSLLSHVLNWQVSAAIKVAKADRFPIYTAVGRLSRIECSLCAICILWNFWKCGLLLLVSVEHAFFYCFDGPSAHFSYLQTHIVFQKHSYKSCLVKENNSSIVIFLPIQQKNKSKDFILFFVIFSVIWWFIYGMS